MLGSKRNRLLAGFLTTLFVAFLFIGGATGQDVGEGWEDGVATKLATDLEQTLREAYERSLKAPPQQTAFQQRQRDAAQGVIRRARDLGEDYARKMRGGWTREASEPYFRIVAAEVANIWDTAGDAEPAESAKPLIDRLQEILDELRALYDADSLPG
jgi:hypothetical protein